MTEPLSNQLGVSINEVRQDEIYQRVNQQRRRHAEYRDRQLNSRGRTLKKDDYVYVVTHPVSSKLRDISAKLCPKTLGPFRVIKETIPNSYLIVDLEIGAMESQNVRNLIYHSSSPTSNDRGSNHEILTSRDQPADVMSQPTTYIDLTNPATRGTTSHLCSLV